MRRYRWLFAILWQCMALFFAVPALAVPNHIAAQLVVEAPAPPRGIVTVAIVMRPEPGWHGYWLNPGDAGQGMTLSWIGPYGTVPGPPHYPVPQTLLIGSLMNHVYEREYAVLNDIKLSNDAHPGDPVPLQLTADWLACSDQLCVPEHAVLTTDARVARPGEIVKPDPRFDQWRRALPAPLGAKARLAVTPQTLRLAIPLPASVRLDDPHMFVAQDKLVDYAGLQKFSRSGDLLIVELPRAKFAPANPDFVAGVLRLTRDGDDGLRIEAELGQVPPDGKPLAVSGGEAGRAMSLPWLLLAALAGGLLLNVMPCVFPILSLKALSLARAGESQAQARAEGLAYTAGVMLACLALGGLILALRAAGEEVGWAFQLQEPWVVVLLTMLAVAITANLAGLFELSLPGLARAGSPQGAFATGLLAAFAATPCTGPFMAAAMGAALLLPVTEAMLLFGALGLGLALPFLAIAFVPALRRLLPRPGAWMARFRRIMAVPMGLTALALLWLCWRLGGQPFAMAVTGVAVALLAALLFAGKRQRRGKSAAAPALAGMALALAAAIGLPRLQTAPEAGIDSILPTRNFSEAALASARASGKPVFAYFTADWCVTCKVNERVAIERGDVREAFARKGVVVLRGDWTRRDPAITRFLLAQDAAGVPLYLWYPAGNGSPRKLDQILAPGTLTALAAE
jgi:DsbC/DsbD-like thiol-disulfide interchange protein/cytochrome c biogenesis protein CcdA